MIQCRLCGHRFDETKIGPCDCDCPFGDCHGANVKCPNCGYDMPISYNESQIKKESFFNKIKQSFK